jgi:tRNA A37 threonylcarbamoyltransferase TsaD
LQQFGDDVPIVYVSYSFEERYETGTAELTRPSVGIEGGTTTVTVTVYRFVSPGGGDDEVGEDADDVARVLNLGGHGRAGMDHVTECG